MTYPATSGYHLQTEAAGLHASGDEVADGGCIWCPKAFRAGRRLVGFPSSGQNRDAIGMNRDAIGMIQNSDINISWHIVTWYIYMYNMYWFYHMMDHAQLTTNLDVSVFFETQFSQVNKSPPMHCVGFPPMAEILWICHRLSRKHIGGSINGGSPKWMVPI
jgi:hypothetical protein